MTKLMDDRDALIEKMKKHTCVTACLETDEFPPGKNGRPMHRNTNVARLLLGLSQGDGVQARHLCHNPRCVNINHLEPGSAAENSSDMVRAGRSRNGSSRQVSRPAQDLDVIEYAIRYCMTRRSYAFDDGMGLAAANWSELSEATKAAVSKAARGEFRERLYRWPVLVEALINE